MSHHRSGVWKYEREKTAAEIISKKKAELSQTKRELQKLEEELQKLESLEPERTLVSKKFGGKKEKEFKSRREIVLKRLTEEKESSKKNLTPTSAGPAFKGTSPSPRRQSDRVGIGGNRSGPSPRRVSSKQVGDLEGPRKRSKKKHSIDNLGEEKKRKKKSSDKLSRSASSKATIDRKKKRARITDSEEEDNDEEDVPNGAPVVDVSKKLPEPLFTPDSSSSATASDASPTAFVQRTGSASPLGSEFFGTDDETPAFLGGIPANVGSDLEFGGTDDDEVPELGVGSKSGPSSARRNESSSTRGADLGSDLEFAGTDDEVPELGGKKSAGGQVNEFVGTDDELMSPRRDVLLDLEGGGGDGEEAVLRTASDCWSEGKFDFDPGLGMAMFKPRGIVDY